MFASGSCSRNASFWPMQSGASGNASFMVRLPAMWSACPCVFKIAASPSPRCESHCRNDQVSKPGSNTIASAWPGRHRR